MITTLMWEARAAEGRGAELLAWARRHGPTTGRRAPRGLLRREVFTAPGDRVLVLTWWQAPEEEALPELPEPPPALLRREVHRWRFTRVESTESHAGPGHLDE